ncbi:MAG: toll/interleukin-1 receptor domain-containing protein, partial [Deltaproteobacteria bacterium]|nr:toll/interleukin-1 receptor domain-containing protein [Deltaproteobacteria bacterium]
MASTIARALNDYGYDYWYDGRMVSAAQRWEDEAGQALANCGSAIVVFDDSYLAKIQDESSGVNPEWAQIDGRIRSVPRDFKLIPVVIDGVRRTSLPPSARQLGIVRWPNEGSSLHAEEVASAIDQLLAAIDST